MRADARRNRERLLEVARVAVAEHGADASLREIARRADVGLGTLYRHFPTRDDLLAGLLQQHFAELAASADALAASSSARDALVVWFRECVTFAREYRSVTTAMMEAIEDPDSALHASCVAMRASGARLLTRAQEEESARHDVDGTDLFALIAALAWVGDQAPARADHLITVTSDAILLPVGG